MFNLFSNPFVRKMATNKALIVRKELPLRRLKLHEYQAGKLLHKFRVNIPLGNVAFNGKEAYLVAKQMGENKPREFVVKAQVLGGGRGLGYFKETGFKGGVHIVKTPEEVQQVAEKMCGKTLVTKQSGEAGLQCNCVYIVEKISIEKEFYLSLTLDRKAGKPVFIYSTAGGMSIEDVAHEHPDKIFKLYINPLEELNIDDLLKAAKDLGLEEHKS
jgi:succinyl-CoA synthetase beta subunit